jgi:4-hydroxybenzoate polyprenyltransferase
LLSFFHCTSIDLLIPEGRLKEFGACSSMIYPFMKRITYWPQAWLSIAANFGGVVAWVVVTNEFDLQLLALMTGAWAWTMHLGWFTSSPSSKGRS